MRNDEVGILPALQLAEHLGNDTATALINAAASAYAGKYPAHEGHRTWDDAKEIAATILLAALEGLDGSEMGGDLDIEERADEVALHVGATFGRRIRAAEQRGRRQASAAILTSELEAWPNGLTDPQATARNRGYAAVLAEHRMTTRPQSGGER